MERFANSPIGDLVRMTGIDGRNGLNYDVMAYVAHRLEDEPELSAQTWREVNSANRALARLDQAARLVPNPDILRQPTLRREAQSTSALEGTFAPLEDVLAVDADEDALSREMKEVMNYIAAANYAFDAVQETLTVALLQTAHHLLVDQTESDTPDKGRVRRIPVAIGSPTGLVEDARFVPMPPGADLESAARDLVDWIRTPASPRDPLVAAAMAHYQFETLHPFNDGNGRLGRLLIVLQFLGDGLLTEPLLSVSPWFEARRIAYQDALAAVSETGDWDAWVRFFCAGIEASATDTAARVDRLLGINARYVEKLRDEKITGVARDIADMLIGTPVVTVPSLSRTTGRTSQAVNTALLRLVKAGILMGPIGSYNRRFFALDVMDAITAPPGTVKPANAPLRTES
ncbi:Fic family protein [Dermacoccus sp. BD5]|uniref:Fic family protein n=1 Tax=Dermacoccus sp. BD5 TaxID=2953656 RepID=UPI0038420313